jgi:polar amino acid transport system substrate-binding protein
VREVESLERGYDLLSKQTVDAMVYDRPELLYFLQRQPDSHLAVSNAEYMRQNYGFALQLSSELTHVVNLNLLGLEESGRVDQIVKAWLGQSQQ